MAIASENEERIHDNQRSKVCIERLTSNRLED